MTRPRSTGTSTEPRSSAREPAATAKVALGKAPATAGPASTGSARAASKAAPVNAKPAKAAPAKAASAKSAPAKAKAAKAEPAPAAAKPAEPAAGLELYLLRHADAGDPARWTGGDAERPLSSKGRRQAKRLGRLLKDLDVKPDAVITSPKLRAGETARLVSRSIGARPSIDDRLSFDFGSEELAALVAGLEANVRSVVLVGHDPDFSSILSWLAGCPIEMRKGALARIDLADRKVGPGRGSLRWLLPPDAVPG